MSLPQTILTSGDFESETIAWNVFDNLISRAQAFRIHSEVVGDYIHPRPLTELKKARIDRILIPLERAYSAGWTQGVIGIEGKTSGKKVGPVVAQALDYTRCVFEIEKWPGILVVPQFIFIFPMQNPYCDVESIMAQNRIGHCWIEDNCRIVFSCGGTNGIVIEGTGDIKAKHLPMGYKRGSR